MAKVREEQPLVPSVLDRLIDNEPDNHREIPKSRNQVLRELKQSVRRDIENLLNTRWRCITFPEDMEELDLSLVNYGIPDFTGMNMNQTGKREELRRVIEHVIRKFEPRFKTVRVSMLEPKDDFDRTVRYRIDALLYAEPAPEPVVFDSQLEPISSTFEITPTS